MEKLHELHEEGGYDLIVVDTPPSRARARLPRRAAAPHPAARQPDLPAPDDADPHLRPRGERRGAAVPAHRREGRSAPRCSTTSSPSSGPSRGWSTGSGPGPPGSTSCSLTPTTAFVLITSPRRDAVDEAEFFAGRLRDAGSRRRRARREPGPPRLRRASPGRRARAASPRRRARAARRRRGRPPRRPVPRTSPTTSRSPTTSATAWPTSAQRIGAGHDRLRPVARPRRRRLRGARRRARNLFVDDAAPATSAKSPAVATVLIAADGAWIRNQVRSALAGPDQTVLEVDRGQDVRDAVASRTSPTSSSSTSRSTTWAASASRSTCASRRPPAGCPTCRSCCSSTGSATGSSPSAPTSTPSREAARRRRRCAAPSSGSSRRPPASEPERAAGGQAHPIGSVRGRHYTRHFLRAVAQFGSALRSGRRGPGFKSRQPDHSLSRSHPSRSVRATGARRTRDDFGS